MTLNCVGLYDAQLYRPIIITPSCGDLFVESSTGMKSKYGILKRAQWHKYDVGIRRLISSCHTDFSFQSGVGKFAFVSRENSQE